MERRQVLTAMGGVIGASLLGCKPNTPPPAAYPSKPINLTVAFPAGGSSDIQARVLGPYLEKELGQPVVVVNKAGAAGQVAWTEVAGMAPDGYNLTLINMPDAQSHVLDPSRQAKYTMEDFTPVSHLAVDPACFFVKGDSKYKTLQDLVDDAKARPNQVTVARVGVLSATAFALSPFEQAAGVKFRGVSFDGGAQMLQAVLGGQVDFTILVVNGRPPRVRSGELRALGVMAEKRSKALPDVPTLAELGYPGLVAGNNAGVFGPKGMPAPVVKKLQDALKKILTNPDAIQKIEQAGGEVTPIMGDDYTRYLNGLNEQYAARAKVILAAQK